MKRKRPTSTFKQKPLTPSVTFQPQTYQGFQRGINLLADAMRPTLGPVPRVVAVEPVGPGDKRPELLDDAGLIARRMLQLPGRDADTGAMFLRHVIWRQHERVGDGTATTAVLFQQIYNRGVTYIQAGGNAMHLRQHLERGLRVAVSHLRAMATPLCGRRQIAHMAMGICHDQPLSEMLAEIFDLVSEHGAIEVRSGRGMGLERQYVIGTYYKGKPLSEWMLADRPDRRVELHDAAVLVTDLNLEEPAELVPLLHAIDAEQISGLLITAREVSAPAMAALLAARQAPQPCQVVVVKAPDAVTGQDAMLDDLALITGGRRFLRVTGDSLLTLRPGDLGRARRAWADEEFFGIVSGRGSAPAMRTHVAQLRAALENSEDPQTRQKIRERLGKLLGGTAVLWVGGIGEIDIKVRKELAERTLAAVRAAIGVGVVPGGGSALLACRAPLRQLAEQASDLDEAMAYRILIRALEEPTRAILWNAGYDSARAMAEFDRAGPGYGLDVLGGRVAAMAEAGGIDSAGVLEAALHSAIASAALALTVDVIVHTRLPELSFEP
jgi:chaperonin GroEL